MTLLLITLGMRVADCMATWHDSRNIANCFKTPTAPNRVLWRIPCKKMLGERQAKTARGLFQTLNAFPMHIRDRSWKGASPSRGSSTLSSYTLHLCTRCNHQKLIKIAGIGLKQTFSTLKKNLLYMHQQPWALIVLLDTQSTTRHSVSNKYTIRIIK